MRICKGWEIDGRERGGKGIAETNQSRREIILEQFLGKLNGFGTFFFGIR
jgi:hypothetical protein